MLLLNIYLIASFLSLTDGFLSSFLNLKARNIYRLSADLDNFDSNILDRVIATAISASHRAGKLMLEEIGAEIVKTKHNSKDLLTKIDGLCQNAIKEEIDREFGVEGYSFLGEENVLPGAEASTKALQDILKNSDFVWIVDPIDGTTNFVHSMPLSAVSIGVVHRGKIIAGCIYDPYSKETFTATVNNGAYLNGNRISVGPQKFLDEALVAGGSPPNMLSLAPSMRGITALAPHVRSVRMLGSAAIMLAWVACGRLTAYFEPDLNAWDVCAGALLITEAGGTMSNCDGEDYDISTRSILASNGQVHADIIKILKKSRATLPDISLQI